MTYQRRDLQIEFTLGEGDFDGQGGNVITLKNMKCELSIAANGGVSGTTMALSLYGLSLDYMAKLTIKSHRWLNAKQNAVRVRANDDLVFSGSIVAARVDLNRMPDAPIELTANAVTDIRRERFEDTSLTGDLDIGQVAESIATRAGLKFINRGVTARASSLHLPGNAVEQLNKLARDYRFNVDMSLGLVIIYPDGQTVDDIAPHVSPAHGLKGYPVFTDNGISFRCMYSPLIRIGRKLILESDLPHASGEYLVLNGTTFYLSSYTEGGLWDAFVVAWPLNLSDGGIKK
ncbi:hypothetical protein ABW11_21005 [Pluralibacter gergoviae]|uniref:baseplate hub protein n=1 Tax=Pluralibacter gergoviae TaxID=61647 RepID=UPI00065101B3|nr:hypothetical protein [Pluralibacter gergoviae]KMK23092.1 hypothetical protein ABW11_21005 [Pluralibacter gergoviae]